jgi:hypothetical protein
MAEKNTWGRLACVIKMAAGMPLSLLNFLRNVIVEIKGNNIYF